MKRWRDRIQDLCFEMMMNELIKYDSTKDIKYTIHIIPILNTFLGIVVEAYYSCNLN